MRKQSFITAGAISAMFAAAPALAAADDSLFPPAGLPAVSGMNWKAAIGGGFIDIENQKTDGRIQGELSFTLPVTFSTGLQIDASLGDLGGSTTGSIGAHYFTRNPASYLLGIWTGYAAVGSNDIFRIGPEFELYWDNITLQGTFGFEDSNTDGGDFYSLMNLALYPSPNLKLYAGYRRTLNRDAGAIGFEWLTGQQTLFNTPMSLFAEAQAGSDSHATLFAGIRFYFGEPDKSLIRRHREDDPGDPSQALNQLAGQCVPFLLSDSSVDSCGNSTMKTTSVMTTK